MTATPFGFARLGFTAAAVFAAVFFVLCVVVTRLPLRGPRWLIRFVIALNVATASFAAYAFVLEPQLHDDAVECIPADDEMENCPPPLPVTHRFF